MNPLNALLTIGLLVTQLLIIKEPLTSLWAFLWLMALFIKKRQGALIRKTLTYSKWPIILIFIVNPLIVNLGDHVLCEVSLGGLYMNISLESLVYSGVMALKLLGIILIFQVTGLLVSSEDLFTFTSQYCRQLTLTFSMSGNAVRSIQQEYQRVQMVMITRGMALNGQNKRESIRNRLYLIKVVLISVLEGAFHRSEALYVRHYTKSPGSVYQPLQWTKWDLITCFILVGILIQLVISSFMGLYTYVYYPSLTGDLHGLPLISILISYALVVYGIKEQEKNAQL